MLFKGLFSVGHFTHVVSLIGVGLEIGKIADASSQPHIPIVLLKHCSLIRISRCSSYHAAQQRLTTQMLKGELQSGLNN